MKAGRTKEFDPRACAHGHMPHASEDLGKQGALLRFEKRFKTGRFLRQEKWKHSKNVGWGGEQRGRLAY
jgi:hypothetical protein